MIRGKYALAAEILGIDKISAPISRMSAAVRRATGRMGGDFDRMDSRVRKFGRTATTALGIGGLAGGMAAAGRGMASVVTKGADLEHAITGAWVRSGEATTAAGKRINGTYLKLEEAAMRYGATTEFTAVQVAGSLDAMALAGVNATESISRIEGIIDFSTAVGQDQIDGVTDSLLNMFNALGHGVEKNPMKRMGRWSEMLERFATTLTNSNIRLEHLQETIKTGGSAAVAAGLSELDILAFTGIVGNAGLRGTEAGTALKNVSLQLAAKSNIKTLKQMGIETFEMDAFGKKVQRSFDDIFRELTGKLKGRASKEVASLLNEIFGLRGITPSSQLVRLMTSDTEAFKNFQDVISNADGMNKSLREMAAIMRATRKVQMRLFTSALSGLAIELSKATDDMFGRALKNLTNWITSLSKAVRANPERAKLVVQIMLVVAALSALAVVIAVIVSVAAFATAALTGTVALIALVVAGVIFLVWTFWEEIKKGFNWLAENSKLFRYLGINPIGGGEEDENITSAASPSGVANLGGESATLDNVLSIDFSRGAVDNLDITKTFDKRSRIKMTSEGAAIE